MTIDDVRAHEVRPPDGPINLAQESQAQEALLAGIMLHFSWDPERPPEPNVIIGTLRIAIQLREELPLLLKYMDNLGGWVFTPEELATAPLPEAFRIGTSADKLPVYSFSVYLTHSGTKLPWDAIHMVNALNWDSFQAAGATLSMPPRPGADNFRSRWIDKMPLLMMGASKEQITMLASLETWLADNHSRLLRMCAEVRKELYI
jgi:hypothetical protein